MRYGTDLRASLLHPKLTAASFITSKYDHKNVSSLLTTSLTLSFNLDAKRKVVNDKKQYYLVKDQDQQINLALDYLQFIPKQRKEDLRSEEEVQIAKKQRQWRFKVVEWAAQYLPFAERFLRNDD